MEVKLIELRDRNTFISMLAVRCRPENAAERYLLARAGYGDWAMDQAKCILFARLGGGAMVFPYDPRHSGRGPRTFRVAHTWLLTHWDEVATGDVVDVEYLLCETDTPKRPEREE